MKAPKRTERIQREEDLDNALEAADASLELLLKKRKQTKDGDSTLLRLNGNGHHKRTATVMKALQEESLAESTVERVKLLNKESQEK